MLGIRAFYPCAEPSGCFLGGLRERKSYQVSWLFRFIASSALTFSLASCDPVTERRYIDEGAGVDLYTSDRAVQVELLNEYVRFICAQTGPTCDNTTFVEAGMNDIDLRCDGFLTWLDARRRDKEPVLAELSAINTAVHSVMTVTGSSPTSLNIVTTAFGLASATYANWNSRLLIAVNQSTVQEVVYKSQGAFRAKIKDYVVPDQPTAVYLLRNYLRLCMPTTIEASINTTTTLVQRDVPVTSRNNLVVANTAPPRAVVRSQFIFREDDAGVALTKYLYPNGTNAARDPNAETNISNFLKTNNINVPISIFLNSEMYANDRITLARQLMLIK
jgi:hypothetical protein